MSKWYPIGSYSFRVVIGNRKIGFSRVSGIKLINPSENSVNVSVLKQGTPKITRVVGVEIEDKFNSENDHLDEGSVLVLEKAIQPNKPNSNQKFLLDLYNQNVDIDEIKIEVLDNSRKVVMIIKFQQCFVMSFELSELDAISGDYLKQIIKIKYHYSAIQPLEN